jgi:hypothetical protein
MTDLKTSPSLVPAEPCLLADDILRGAEAIAQELYGDKTPASRRKVYHVAENGKLPTFRLGAILCARKSKLLAWIIAQENASVGAK